ncbi:2OG-Fe(II) oxygenase [Nocardia sp. NPDC003183]
MRLAEFDLTASPVEVGECVIGDVARLDGELAAVRVCDVLSVCHAQALSRHLAEDLVYAREQIGDTKRVSRAVRQGELPDSPIVTRRPPLPDASSALALFTEQWWLEQLSQWFDAPLEVLRPPSPYRMDAGDYVRPHDDCPAPEFRLSVTFNLTQWWRPEHGGETSVGTVGHVAEFDDPEWYFPRKVWTMGRQRQSFVPQFNSALLLPLSPSRVHEVLPVTQGPRYSITTLYGTVG